MKQVFALFLTLLFSLPAAAATVTAAGTNATQYTDNSAITSALTTQIWDSFGSPPFNKQIGSGGPLPVTLTVPVQAGTHVFTAVQCDAANSCSAPSNAVTVAVTPPVPKAITNLTVTVGP
jgi:hypothetical protein